MTKTQAALVHLNPEENTTLEVLVMARKRLLPTYTYSKTRPDKKTTLKTNQTRSSTTKPSSTHSQMSSCSSLSNCRKKRWCNCTNHTTQTLTVTKQLSFKTTTTSSLLKTERLSDQRWMTTSRATRAARLPEVVARWTSWRMKARRCFMGSRRRKTRWCSLMRMSATGSMTAYIARGPLWARGLNSRRLALGPASNTTPYRWSQRRSEKSMKY